MEDFDFPLSGKWNIDLSKGREFFCKGFLLDDTTHFRPYGRIYLNKIEFFSNEFEQIKVYLDEELLGEFCSMYIGEHNWHFNNPLVLNSENLLTIQVKNKTKIKLNLYYNYQYTEKILYIKHKREDEADPFFIEERKLQVGQTYYFYPLNFYGQPKKQQYIMPMGLEEAPHIIEFIYPKRWPQLW